MDRTYVITGSASGIGAATARQLSDAGARVIGVDLRDAEVIADLTSEAGRAALVEGIARLSGGAIDAVIANAGGGPIETMFQKLYLIVSPIIGYSTLGALTAWSFWYARRSIAPLRRRLSARLISR